MKVLRELYGMAEVDPEIVTCKAGTLPHYAISLVPLICLFNECQIFSPLLFP